MHECERGTSTTFGIRSPVHKNFTLFISNHETERTLETIRYAILSSLSFKEDSVPKMSLVPRMWIIFVACIYVYQFKRMSCASLCATLENVFLFSSVMFTTICPDLPQIVDATSST